jgi:hypothetical protein
MELVTQWVTNLRLLNQRGASKEERAHAFQVYL